MFRSDKFSLFPIGNTSNAFRFSADCNQHNLTSTCFSLPNPVRCSHCRPELLSDLISISQICCTMNVHTAFKRNASLAPAVIAKTSASQDESAVLFRVRLNDKQSKPFIKVITDVVERSFGPPAQSEILDTHWHCATCEPSLYQPDCRACEKQNLWCLTGLESTESTLSRLVQLMTSSMMQAF